MRTDLAIYDQFNQLILTVEVKKKFNASNIWAIQTRRNLVAHQFYPTFSYFLLATPEKFFLWKPENNTLEDTSPDFVEDAQKHLDPYLKKLGFNIREIDEYGFEQVVSHWLKYSVMYPINNDYKSKWLAKSGLSEKIRYGNLSFESVI